jgi:hypothetical protein
MVFRIFLASIFILSQGRSIAQIERLTTTGEVLRFVRKVASGYGSISSKMDFPRITPAAFDSLTKSYHLQSFEKADLDGNGLTDLIFNGSRFSYSQSDSFAQPLSLAILSLGKDSFEVRDLSLDIFQDIAAHLIQLDGKPYIQTIRVTRHRIDTNYCAEYNIDTLAWEFNAFIERKSMDRRKIAQIDYNCWNGLAFWVNATLRIINDSVRLKKERFEGYLSGVYLSRLNSNTAQRLYGLLNAIDFVSLKDSFRIGAFDATTGTLKITYDNDQTKTITDYGICGTYGLAELHQLLYGLIKTQPWVNADPLVSRCLDSLHSESEAMGLVRALDMDYPFLDYEPDTPVDALSDFRERSSTFGEQKWQKGDIDDNGHTDLLVNGFMNKDWHSRQYSIVVLSFGGDILRKQEISRGNGFFAAKIIQDKGHDRVAIRSIDTIGDCTQKNGYRLLTKEDTLTACDGYMVELPATALHTIKELCVREDIGSDSLVVTPEIIYWYKNDADYSHLGEPGATVPRDSINLYTLPDKKVAQKLLSIAAGIRFEQGNPQTPFVNGSTKYLGSTWYVNYDRGKRSQLKTYGPIGSYRLFALEVCLWELKHNRTDWNLVSQFQVPASRITKLKGGV